MKIRSQKSEVRNQKLKAKNKAGYKGLQANIRQLKMPKIDIWENMYPDKDYWINMEILEFTCICPKTGLPDFAVLDLKYRPDKKCIELKSFKYYINAYREIGIFHEHVVNKIVDDFVRACCPRQVILTGAFNSRGGIKTTVSREYVKNG